MKRQLYVRSHEDREPTRDLCEPRQEWNALVYDLVVRQAKPWGMRRLVVKHYEDNREADWVLFIDGKSLT